MHQKYQCICVACCISVNMGMIYVSACMCTCVGGPLDFRGFDGYIHMHNNACLHVYN